MDIPVGNVVRVHYRRRNLNITVAAASAGSRLEQLTTLLASPRFRHLGSAIVYVATRAQAEEAAAFLRAGGVDAGAYHAGLGAQARRRTQVAFVNGRLRVVAATVAFGMGLNKADVRAVVHLAPPRSLESYAQELGRAGRDGKPAECHCFFSATDFERARSLVFTHRCSLTQVRGLVAAAFGRCVVSQAGDGDGPEQGVYVSICLDELEEKTELAIEVAATVLARLQEADADVTVYPDVHSKLVVGFLAEPSEIRGGLEGQLAKLFVKLGRRRNGTFTVELAALLELAGLELDRLLSAVSRLKATHKVWLRWEKTAHFVRNTARFVSMQEVERRVETLTHKLFAELTSFEDRQLLRAQVMEDTLQLASSRNGPEQAALVNDVMEQYFASSDYATFAAGLATRLERELGPKPKPSASSDAELSATVSELIEGCTSLGGNPIALARILHAIPARSYPRAAWRGNRHWGRFAGELFPRLLGRVQLVLDERKDIFNFK